MATSIPPKKKITPPTPIPPLTLPPHHNSPYAPRSSIPSEDHHSKQDDEVQEIVQKLQEKRYTPSSTNYIVDSLSEHIAQHITQQIHQKGFKPVTSHYINKGVDQLVKKAERNLNKRMEQQQQQNRINYTLSNTQTQEKSSTLSSSKNPKTK